MACASESDANWCTFKHSSRSLPLHDSIQTFSTGFAWSNQVTWHTVSIGPLFQHPRWELGAVIDRGPRSPFRTRSNASPTVIPDIRTPTSRTGLWRLQVSTTVTTRNGRQSARVSCTKPCSSALSGPPVPEPGLGATRYVFRLCTLMRNCRPPQIHSSHPLPIHEPALAPQEHPDAQGPKPRARISQISNAYPQGKQVLGSASSIPGRPTELRQTTGPQATDLKGVLQPAGQCSTACGP
jgi:hypothetical protein